jgi:hypothetical protein
VTTQLQLINISYIVDGIKQCHKAASSTTNLTRSGLGCNPRLRDDRPAINEPSRGTILTFDVYRTDKKLFSS